MGGWIVFKKSIYQYENYRKFLQDFYLRAKETQPEFSFRIFSEKAGFKSTSFFKLVIQGKRNLTEDSIEKIALALKLSNDQTYFFRNLVFHNQAETVVERHSYVEKLIKAKEYKKLHPLSKSQYRYYSQWYYVPIRELVGLKIFREDYDWIARSVSPAISTAEAEKAIVELIALGLLKRDTQGKLLQFNENLETEAEVFSSSIAQYHREMIQKASESIDRFPRQKRDITCVTVPMNEENISKIKDLIYKCRSDIMKLAVGQRSSTSIYQLNFQLFPLAECADEKKKNDN